MLPQFGYHQQKSITLPSRSAMLDGERHRPRRVKMRLRFFVCAATLLVPAAFSQAAAPAQPKQSPSQIQSPSYDDLVAKALASLGEKKAKEAAALSEQAIGQNEKRWEAYATAASAYSAQQLYDDSIGMLQMALGRAPEGKKQAIRDAITAARRQIAAQSAPKVSEFGPRTESAPGQALTVQAEAALWKAIENSTQAEDYQGYLSKYPEGTFAPIAKTRLEAFLKKQTEEAAKEGRTTQAQAREEAVLWTNVKDSKDSNDYRAYLDKYPDGTFAPIARRRMEELAGATLEDLAGTSWNVNYEWVQKKQQMASTAVVSFAPDGVCAHQGDTQFAQPCRWTKVGQVVTITHAETRRDCGAVWSLALNGNTMSGTWAMVGCPSTRTSVTMTVRK